MAHLSGHCECGRRIHFPNAAAYGCRWTCHRCGRSYTLSHKGDPLHRVRSRRASASSRSRQAAHAPAGIDWPGFIWAPWMTAAVVVLVVYAVFGGIGLAILVGGWLWVKHNG